MGLFVKWGSEIRVAEGQTLYAIRQYLDNTIPFPEIYGWRADRGEVFLYMEVISGQSLEQAWPDTKEDDRRRDCRELRVIFDQVRQLKQAPSDMFIGK